MGFQVKNFTLQELNHFSTLQAMAFDLQKQTAQEMQEGMTEKDVTTLMMKKYRAAGAGNYFHLPVALFGERTALPGTWPVGKFFPKKCALQTGDSVILDAAPLFDGYLVDTSYSFCFGAENSPNHANVQVHKQMMRDLLTERSNILESVNAGETFQKIARDLATRAAQNGYENAHQKHPGEVLGHRGGRWTGGLNLGIRLQGFDAATLMWFKMKDQLAQFGLKQQGSLWNHKKASDVAPTDGLWMVEPHFGKGDVGAKWEEILVIEKGRARWLQEMPPHVVDNTA